MTRMHTMAQATTTAATYIAPQLLLTVGSHEYKLLPVTSTFIDYKLVCLMFVKDGSLNPNTWNPKPILNLLNLLN